MIDFLRSPQMALSSEQWMVLGFAFALMLISALYIARPALKRILGEWQVDRAVRRMGREVMREVRLSDGMDGNIYMDYLVLTATGILVIAVKRFPGVIFGAQNTDQWAQVLNHRTYKFGNPLRELQTSVLAIKALLPDVPVEGHVLFGAGSSFPKGRPQGVLLLDELLSNPRVRDAQVLPPSLQSGWDALRMRGEPDFAKE